MARIHLEIGTDGQPEMNCPYCGDETRLIQTSIFGCNVTEFRFACMGCGEHIEIETSKFQKRLSNYLDKMGMSIVKFAEQVGTNIVSAQFWKYGQRKGSRKVNIFPNYMNLVSMIKAGHKDFVFNSLLKDAGLLEEDNDFKH